MYLFQLFDLGEDQPQKNDCFDQLGLIVKAVQSDVFDQLFELDICQPNLSWNKKIWHGVKHYVKDSGKTRPLQR